MGKEDSKVIGEQESGMADNSIGISIRDFRRRCVTQKGSNTQRVASRILNLISKSILERDAEEAHKILKAMEAAGQQEFHPTPYKAGAEEQ